MSSEITLIAESGRTTGTRSSGRLRTEGQIPGVVYGHGITPLSVSINRRELRAVLHTEAGHNAVINLTVGSDKHLTIVKELQRHPVRNEVIHVDFLVVNPNEQVTVDVPLILTGEAKAIIDEHGTVDQQMHSLSVHTTPGNIPNEIQVDVTDLAIGGQIKVGDLTLPKGVATEVDAEETIVLGQVTRAAIEIEELDAELAEAVAEEAAEAEGESADAEGGDDAAEAGDADAAE
jgi:large subunit ribosomal protein L25